MVDRLARVATAQIYRTIQLPRDPLFLVSQCWYQLNLVTHRLHGAVAQLVER